RLYRRLARIHDLTGDHEHTGAGQRARHVAPGPVVGPRLHHRQHVRAIHLGTPKSSRAPMINTSAYTPAMRSSTMTPAPPWSDWDSRAGKGFQMSKSRKRTNAQTR